MLYFYIDDEVHVVLGCEISLFLILWPSVIRGVKTRAVFTFHLSGCLDFWFLFSRLFLVGIFQVIGCGDCFRHTIITSEPRKSSSLSQQLSIALQRGNVVAFVNTYDSE